MARQQYTDEELFEQRDVLGAYYANITMQDLINNFIFAYTGKGKFLTNVTRQEVAFWAQRSVQEFAYDITRSEVVEELDVNMDTLTAHVPPDFVNLNQMTIALDNGEELQMKRVFNHSFSVENILHDENGEPLFDDRGEVITSSQSESARQFQQPKDVYERALVEDLYWSDYYFNSDYEYGRRYGIDPSRANLNPQYYLSLQNATIYFNDRLTHLYTSSGTKIVKLYYISDGLKDSSDFTKVLIPKLAEDAVYENILYQISRLRPDTAPAGASYQKSAMAKKRNAKIRIQGYQNLDWQQLVKQKSKWIKY